MRLTADQRRILQDLLARPDAGFTELARIAKLDKTRDFVRANLRGVDFGTADLSGFNFAQADLRGADLTLARGKDRLVLIDARTDNTTRGLPPNRELQEGPGPAMVLVPEGRFLMGVPARENQREKVPKEQRGWTSPQHEVTIPRPFYLGKYPVTVEEFRLFAVETNHAPPAKAWTYEPDDKGEWSGEERDGRGWDNPGFAQTGRHPVTCVSHDDATAYAAWLSDRTGQAYRLPSEAEWEYAARAGTETARYWGEGRKQACRYANVADETLRLRMNRAPDPEMFFPSNDGFAFTAPVGSFLPNGFGLYDMLGNVWEWTADHWRDNYANCPKDGSANTTGDSGRRVLRGGSWNDDPGNVRAGVRDGNAPGNRYSIVGFRLARTPFSS